MTNVQSKIATTVMCTCKDFQHPWTEDCVNASAGLLLTAIPYCLRVYSAVYFVSMVMKQKIPSKNDIKKTVLGILQSTGFLSTNAFTFILYNCIIRNLLGKYHLSTVAFWPCFFAAWTAIVVERPARRPLLALYVANVATETLWNMMVARNWIRPIRHGETLIFGFSVSILLYLFRLGLHKTTAKDPIFNILRIFVSKSEEGPIQPTEITNQPQPRRPISVNSIRDIVALYGRLIETLKSKHPTCSHKEACTKYALMGGLKPFIGGVGIQVLLKTILNIKKVVQMKMDWKRHIFNRSTLKLGIFLGSFSFLYKGVSCSLRHIYNCDKPIFALPAGLIGSVAFTQYPDVTVALYVMWKMIQLTYNLGIAKGILPTVPGFLYVFYSTCTAILFHSAIIEPKTLRPSYYKFLEDISGGRFSRFHVEPFDIFGYDSLRQSKEVQEKLKIVVKSALPPFAFAS